MLKKLVQSFLYGVLQASVPSRAKFVYALLDSQSDSSFILDRTLDSCIVSSINVNLSVDYCDGLYACRRLIFMFRLYVVTSGRHLYFLPYLRK